MVENDNYNDIWRLQYCNRETIVTGTSWKSSHKIKRSRYSTKLRTFKKIFAIREILQLRIQLI